MVAHYLVLSKENSDVYFGELTDYLYMSFNTYVMWVSVAIK